MSRGIDFSKLEPEPEQPQGQTRHLAHLARGMSVEEFLAQAEQQYPFYGLLLPGPGDSQLNRYVRASWESVHMMSGSACMLLTTLVPDHPTRDMRDFLINLVGEEKANQAWKEYRYSPQKVANDVYILAQQLQIDYSKLPCLVLMADLGSQQRVIQRLPDWDDRHLSHLFEALFDKTNKLAHEPDAQKRYTALKGELGLGFKLRQQVGHTMESIQETLVHVEWSEVIQATLTNKELMASAFKVMLGVFGLAAG
jgi:hypothetical protein